MPKRSRDKQLAKLAQRRQAERRAAKRRRDLTIGLVAGGIALILVAVGAFILFGGDDQTGAASPSASSPEPRRARSRRRRPRPRRSPAAGRCPRRPTSPSRTFAGPPPMTIDPSHTYTATIETSCGTIEAELLAKTATEGVNSFVFLAQQGFYDGQTFHRIVEGLRDPGRRPAGDGTGGPGYEFPVTTTEGVSFDGPGVLAYAHAADRRATGVSSSSRWRPQPEPRSAATASTRSSATSRRGRMCVRRRSRPCPRGGPSGEPSQPTEAVYINSVTIDGVLGATAGPRSANPSPP